MTRKQVEVQGRVWLTLDGKPLLGKGRVELLTRIEATGSISSAAKAMKMSYKAAWDAVDAMNKVMGKPVIESAIGGSKGGGSKLTAAGKKLIAEYSLLEEKHRKWLVSTTEKFAENLLEK